MERSVYVRLYRNETGNGSTKKVKCKRLRKTILGFFCNSFSSFTC
jgi:hypothetical protein